MCGKFYKRCLDWDPHWKYNVRRKAKIWLPISANIVLFIIMVIAVVCIYWLIDRHLTQTVLVSALKSIQMEASTIAEL
jgi:hypothetical protein